MAPGAPDLSRLRGMAALPSTILLRVSLEELRYLLGAVDELAQLREAARAALAELARRGGDPSHCGCCRGSGMVEPWCRYCGDSTYDHDCPPAEPCDRCQGTGRIPAVVALVALLPKAEG